MQRLAQKRDPEPFATCLPRTVRLARQRRAELEPHLAETPKKWAFEDRVLAALVPALRDSVRRFYEENGKALVDLFARHQIEHIDRDLSRELRELLGCDQLEAPDEPDPSPATGSGAWEIRCARRGCERPATLYGPYCDAHSSAGAALRRTVRRKPTRRCVLYLWPELEEAIRWEAERTRRPFGEVARGILEEWYWRRVRGGESLY